ncbi:WcaF family extracellular polysaccharide biosynthesis acetyltransferase [Ideonella sp. 4Y16]|uniref:WcaF family extracellular polysaccharide biosynthesis acetyltransferase n=1 Tax=Ideonella alba TaxID=2824118 RepID=UPI001B36C8BF|nr:WcaF family extracellular polysaccharide biosynthesis acetyltransferase [Ideonella alba]MBQ0943120.1 WcaF family extracellular polysaccharide biosynthesis acetyltransferase [Ideonella alba]
MNERSWFSLEAFRMPEGFRGRSAFGVQLWWLCEALLFKTSPQFMYGFRVVLLRLFGARVGKRVVIRPNVTVTYPWKLIIEDDVWIGDNVTLYTLGEITIRSNTIVSQGSYICAADHDYTKTNFPIRIRPIAIESGVWIGARVFVCPGVNICSGAVIGAGSVVTKSVLRAGVYAGNPCRFVKERTAAVADSD